MKKYRFEFILFIVEAVYMILELIASRVLSPYFGSSNLVWTSVIGIILLSSSAGNYFGGILADKKETNKKLKIILITAFIFVTIIPFVQNGIISFIADCFSDIRVGAIISTIILFFIPSLLVGSLSPIVLKLKLESMENAGATSGRLQALTTLGGIFGTFFGGFYLIPQYGSIHILFLLAIVLLFMIPIVDWKLKAKEIVLILLCTIILGTFMLYNIETNKYTGTQVKDGEYAGAVSYDTQYGRVLIYNTEKDGEKVRVLNIDSGYESATYVDEDKKYDLVFDHSSLYDLMYKANIEIKDTLLIGGAGYSYPKHYISKNPDKRMDVVEIDGEITEVAKEYFYLNDLIEEFDLENNKRLGLITDDGRTYLNTNEKKYDIVMNDAFSGSTPPKTLTTIEATKLVKKSLNDKGFYMLNVISALEGENSKFIKAECNTLKQVFNNVYVIPVKPETPEIVQNSIVIATDDIIDFEGTYDIEIPEDTIIITDDYCPIDTLVPMY